MDELAYSAGVLTVCLIYLFICLISLALAVVKCIALWKLFEKAGEPGWKSLIPFYNFFEMVRLSTGNYKLAVVYMIAIVPYIIFYMAGAVMMTMDSLKIIGFVLMGIGGLIILGIYALWGYINYKFAQAYGKSAGFCVASIFLSVIMQIVMGFDSNTYYVGPNGQPAEQFYYKQ